MAEREFVGFGFGPIQAGLFLAEARASGGFGTLTVAEVMPQVVEAVRRGGGRYVVNVAETEGIRTVTVDGVEMRNPTVPEDAEALVEAIARASELATALPSVEFFGRGAPSPARLLAEGFARKAADPSLPAAVVYAGENHNHAAEILEREVRSEGLSFPEDRVQFLNTVIGKMSGVVEPRPGLPAAVPGGSRAFLVEAFNRILVTRIRIPGFQRGVAVFEEKPDLLPFEEAKLYGHNAVHALLGYLALDAGCALMSDLPAHPDLLALGREAFLDESGAALVRKYAGVDPLFTADGFRAYAEDLLVRMVNPHLEDRVDRVTRDPARKLGWHDRLIGAMRLVLGQGLTPRRFAEGARSAARRAFGDDAEAGLRDLWKAEDPDPEEVEAVRRLILG